MRIMVFDVPAESGGALTILNQYYDAAIKDTDNEWIFILSTPKFDEHKNIKVLNYPWIKKSWFHRIYFDSFVAHKLVKKYEVDEILSLQNVVIPHINVKQTLYLHQSLPFVEKKYCITENFKFWVYQNIISKMIFNSVKKADEVIVQTKWIMDAAIEKTNVKKEKFVLKQPEMNIQVKKQFSTDNNKYDKVIFFYPSSGLEYKNHRVIVEALQYISPNYRKNYEVVFTLKGNENTHIKKLYKITKEKSLPIRFVGELRIDEVYNYYSKSILIFPSYIETFGLPLLEAKIHSSPIIASDCAFSREILGDYDKVHFFNPFEYCELKAIIENIINKGK